MHSELIFSPNQALSLFVPLPPQEKTMSPEQRHWGPAFFFAMSIAAKAINS